MKKLWIPSKQYVGASIEQIGHHRLREDSWLYAVFCPIDAGMLDDMKAAQAWHYTEWGLERERMPYGGVRVWPSNWVPSIWSLREMWPGDNYHLALAYFQTGLADEGWDILRGTFPHMAFYGPVPGDLGYPRGATDFNDCASMFCRTVVEGLFGYRPDYPNGVVTLAPQFPSAWDRAAIKTPDFSLSYQQGRYQVALAKPAALRFRLPVRATKVVRVLVNGRPAPYRLEPSFGRGVLLLDVPSCAKAEVELKVEGHLRAEPVAEETGPLPDPRLTRVAEDVPPYQVTKVRPITPPTAEPLKISADATWATLDISGACNGDIRAIFKQQYLSPRPNTCPLQPWVEDIRPGMTMGQWGTHFGRTQTWWDMGSAWLAYLGRCQALPQWGARAPGGFSAEGLAVKSIHRTNNDAHAFFVVLAGSGGQALCTFAVDGMQPELWDPVRGTMRNLTDFRQDDGETTVPLEFAPSPSWFVIFRNKAVQPKERRANFPELKPATEIAGPWEVWFDPKWGGPEAATFDQLDDWTKRPERGIRYYSGTATYRKTFDASTGSYLDLGQVKCIGRVRLNGRDLGVVWTAPWGVSVPPGLLRERGNVLEIEVAHVWANRLIGDELEPRDCEWRPGHRGHGGYLKRFPDWLVKNQPRPSKGRYCFTTWNYFTKDSPLTSSGLLGPVRLMSEDWTRSASAPAAKPADGITRKTSSTSPAALEADVLKAGLAAPASTSEERVAHLGGGKDASALFNGTTKNGSGGDATQDDGKTFRGYGAGSVLTIQLNRPHDLAEIRTYAGHADARAGQNYTVFVALAASPTNFVKLATAIPRCDGGASEVRVKTEAKGVVAVRFEFQNGPLGFNVYREINLVGQPATGAKP